MRACDVMIVTDAMIVALASTGELQGATRTTLGSVRTGVAIRAGDPLPDISSAQALKSSLLAADGIYVPDPLRATAGIHFAAMLGKLGIDAAVAARLRAFPNGATAMLELAASELRCPIGCTQITEINHAAGVRLVGALPVEFELATVYSAAVGRARRNPSWRFVSSGTWRTRRHARFGRPGLRVGAFVGRQRQRLGGSADNGAGWPLIAVAARCPVTCRRR